MEQQALWDFACPEAKSPLLPPLSLGMACLALGGQAGDFCPTPSTQGNWPWGAVWVTWSTWT